MAFWLKIAALLTCICCFGGFSNGQAYETVLEPWIFDEPELVNYETCRNALIGSNDWPENVMKDDPNFISSYGINDIVSFRNPASSGAARASVVHRYKLWKNGVVPYTVEYGLNVRDKKLLACAFQYFHEKTCVKFVPRTRRQRDYIAIQRYNLGCFSEDLGKKGGRHIINLHYPYCWNQGIIIHELMHALGFFHEQSRNDRNKYITVHWEHVPQGWREQFMTAREQGLHQKLLGSYDYASIMHYSRTSYAWGYKNVMTAKKGDVEKNNEVMGNRAKPTDMDTAKINQLYSCPGAAGSKKERTKEKVDSEQTKSVASGTVHGEEIGASFSPKILLCVLLVVILVLLIIATAILFFRKKRFQNRTSKTALPTVCKKKFFVFNRSDNNLSQSTMKNNSSGASVKVSAIASKWNQRCHQADKSPVIKRPTRPEGLFDNFLLSIRQSSKLDNIDLGLGAFSTNVPYSSVPCRRAPLPPVAPKKAKTEVANPKVSVKTLASKFDGPISDKRKNNTRSQSESRVKKLERKVRKNVICVILFDL